MNEQFTRAPHRNDTPGPDDTSYAALLIDFDNVTMGIRSNLGQELRKLLSSDLIRGKVAVQRAYADWRRYPQYVVPLSEASIDLIYAPAYGSSKKNATDIRLAIDALEIVFTRPEIGTYILLSGDSDFSSLVLKLKEYGKYVIGVGMQESSSDLLVQNCDEYYSYSSFSGLVEADEMETVRHDPWELAEHSIRKMADRNDVMRSDRMKQVMLELDPSFDEKELGFSKFNRFLAEASSRGILKLSKIGHGQYEVTPGRRVTGDGDADRGGRARRSAQRGAKSSETRGRKEEDRKPVKVDSLRKAYALLCDVVEDLSDDGEAVRDSEVKREMLKRNSSFDETAIGFSKFSRFIGQAHDEGLLDVEKGGDGNYYLKPLGADGGPPSRPPAEKGDGAPRGAGSEAAAEPEAPAREEPAPEGEEPAPGEAEEPASREPAREEREPARAEEEGAAEASGESRTERSPLFRRRGSSSRRPGASEDESEWTPGPVGGSGEGEESGAGDDAGPGGGSKPEREDEAEPASGRRTSSESGSGRSGRSLGRFRRRGKAQDAGVPQEVLSLGNVASSSRKGSGDSGSSAPAPGGRSGEELVGHLTENYHGVGEKTARTLVEEFGGDLMKVLDEEPERVERLLPQHRAEAVLAARSEERRSAASG